MNSQFYQAIVDIVQCDKTVSCLQLCGCNSISDLRSLNAGNIHDIEQYVANICQSMPKEECRSYMREEFVNNPERFMISPIIKLRLFANIERLAESFEIGNKHELKDITNEGRIEDHTVNLDISSMVTKENDVSNEEEVVNHSVDILCIHTKDVSVKKEFGHNYLDEKIIETAFRDPENLLSSDFDQAQDEIDDDGQILDNVIYYKNKSLPNVVKDNDKNHDYVIMKANDKLTNCDLIKYTDFTIYRNTVSPAWGYFNCKLCLDKGTVGKVIKFHYSSRGHVNFNTIKHHLHHHFKEIRA